MKICQTTIGVMCVVLLQMQQAQGSVALAAPLGDPKCRIKTLEGTSRSDAPRRLWGTYVDGAEALAAGDGLLVVHEIESISAFDLSTGKRRWSVVDVVSDGGARLAVEAGKVHAFAPFNQYVVIDAVSGQVESDDRTVLDRLPQGFPLQPQSKELKVRKEGRRLVAIDPSGKELWRVSASSDTSWRDARDLGRFVVALFVSKSDGAGFALIDGTTGSIRWSRDLNEVGPVALTRDSLLVSSIDGLLALDLANSKAQWEIRSTDQYVDPGPILRDGRLVVAALSDGALCALQVPAS